MAVAAEEPLGACCCGWRGCWELDWPPDCGWWPLEDGCWPLLERLLRPKWPLQPLVAPTVAMKDGSSSGWSTAAIKLLFWPCIAHSLSALVTRFLTSWWSSSPSMMHSSAGRQQKNRCVKKIFVSCP